MTIDKVKSIVENCCKLLYVKLDVPVEINNRLTTTLGRVKYRKHLDTGIDEPFIIELSGQLLRTGTEESVTQVVMHEAAHYIAAKTTGIAHKHDAYFKKVCAAIGCTNDGYATSIERTVEKSKVYKYIVKCPYCGCEEGYHRAGKCVQHPEWFMCGKCNKTGLEVIQNW